MYVLGEVDNSFLVEAWVLYAIGIAVLLLRIITRIRAVGIFGFQGDDYMSLLVTACYTWDAVIVHIVYYHSTNMEGARIQESRKLTEGEIQQLMNGSKHEFAGWYCYLTLVWALKGTMVYFFKRMTMGLSQQRLVNYIAVGCLLSYFVIILTITFNCFPVEKNWQIVPDPGKKCTFKPQIFFVMTAFNVLTDIAILFVPLPLLWALKIPIRKKLVIGVLLSSGIFVIAATLIRIVSTLVAHPSALTINRWGVRETLVGVIAVNAPILRPIFSKTFWRHGARTGSYQGPSSVGLSHTAAHGPYEMASSLHGSESVPKPAHGSEENIITKDIQYPNRAKKVPESNVVVQTTYEVTNEAIDGTSWYPGTVAESRALGNRTRDIV